MKLSVHPFLSIKLQPTVLYITYVLKIWSSQKYKLYVLSCTYVCTLIVQSTLIVAAEGPKILGGKQYYRFLFFHFSIFAKSGEAMQYVLCTYLQC